MVGTHHTRDMGLIQTLSQIPAKFRAMAAMLLSLAGFARGTYRSAAAEHYTADAGPIQRARQVSTVISVVVIAVVGLVGTLILANIDSALPAIENDQLNSSSTAILDGFAGAMELLPVVLLVFIAALVISVVQRMRQR